MDEVVVADGAVVIHSERDLAEWEKHQLRLQYQTVEDVEQGLALGEALNKVTAEAMRTFDAIAIGGSGFSA